MFEIRGNNGKIEISGGSEGLSVKTVSFRLTPPPPQSPTYRRRLRGDEALQERIPYLHRLCKCVVALVGPVLSNFNKFKAALSNSMNSMNNNMNQNMNKWSFRMDSEFVRDVCRMFKAIIDNFKGELLHDISNVIKLNFFQGLNQLALVLVYFMPDRSDDMDWNWTFEAFSICTEAIETFIQSFKFRVYLLKQQSPAITEMLSKMTTPIVRAYIDRTLEIAEFEIRSGRSANELSFCIVFFMIFFLGFD